MIHSIKTFDSGCLAFYIKIMNGRMGKSSSVFEPGFVDKACRLALKEKEETKKGINAKKDALIPFFNLTGVG